MENIIEVPADQQKDKGFTLVELLIVIVILGILATVTVFAVRGITDQGQTSACQADAKTLETATEAYFAQEGGTAIPTDNEVATTTIGATAEETLVASGFLRSVSNNWEVSTAGVLTATDPGPCV
jgi:prepilin-type N-terminal cleavage/methylation domain-containing protein